jgi:hypothetical protein
MSRNLKQSALDYLAGTSRVRVAHLVRFELAAHTDAVPAYHYLTDYQHNITYDGKVYEANKITKVGSVNQTQGFTNYKLNIDVAGEYQEELDRALIENTNQSYVGKGILVYRAYLDDSGDIIPFDATTDGPMVYFVGDITNLDITEEVVRGVSTVRWQCAGKFQDFELVNGRITDDTSHRGLVSDPGNPGGTIPSDGAKLPSHQTDTGFQHANQTISAITKYTVKEKRYKLKKSWGGFKSKLKEYEVDVEKELELGIDLAAKYLPTVYGVRKVPGIPVFLGVEKLDPTRVHVVYAFCEGEVESILNLYLDGATVICSSLAEKSNGVCLGRQAEGDTLSAYLDSNSQEEAVELVDRREFPVDPGDNYGNWTPIPILPPATPRDRTVGTSHGDQFTITTGTGTKRITVYHGKPDQAADPDLVAIAAGGGFLNQPFGDTTYWDSNSKLLDTCYAVVQFSIGEEEQEIPSLEAVVSGRVVDTYDTEGILLGASQYTLNPVWHLLDYMRNSVYGGNVSLAEIDTTSFADVAAQLDTITSTYSNEYLTYWSYAGWKTAPVDQGTSGDDPQKTFMQCNTFINTESTVTKNIEGLLKQFDGTLNILGGKYHLSLEDVSAAIADISEDEIIGAIKTKDLSNKDKWNAIQASIINPGVGWGTTQVSFFNQDFLDSDNGIQKKGNTSFAHITNYYTAREWAQIQLAKSRYSREITITTYFKYLFLYPNANVTLSYGRFNYDQKLFRVKSVTLNTDGTVNLVLRDFDASIYDTDLSDDESGETTPSAPRVAPPTDEAFYYLPDPSYVISAENKQGIFVWKSSGESNVLRYEVRDWLDQAPNYTVPVTQLINGDENYILIDGLVPNTDYKFKVRTVSSTGEYSIWRTVKVSTGTRVDPVAFTDVTGFTTSNTTPTGIFNGGDLDLVWDTHPDPNATYVDIEVYGSVDGVFPGTPIDTKEALVGTTYTYTLATNKADYAANNAGAVGAYRYLDFKIKATNGLSVGDPNRVESTDWKDIE